MAGAAASVWQLQLQQLPPPHLHSFVPSRIGHPSSACPPAPVFKYKKQQPAVPLPLPLPLPGRRNLLLCTSSSSSSAAVVAKEQEGPVTGTDDASSDDPAFLSYKDDPNFRGCKGCGRDQLERGCNGDGRIQGGIAAVPGFGWWPIKAYRPCPGFVASGGRYRRQGQSMDDVASGRGKKPAKPSSSSTAKN